MNALRSRASRLLTRLSQSFEQHAWTAVALLLLIYLPAAFDASRSTPLWHDELFTFYIAQAPTLRDLWSDLRLYDLNPPLVYLLTRWSFSLFGVSTLATRLPEIAGFLLWTLCTFHFVRRRMGVAFAFFAALLLLESDLFQLAVDARPYTLMLGFLGLAMVFYQAATSRIAPSKIPPKSARRNPALLGLLLSIAAMLSSHIFALLALAAFVAAELWRTRLRRCPDWPVLAALLLPLTLAATYVPMLRRHGGSIFPPAFQPGGEAIFDFYIASVSRELVALSLTALAVLLLLGPAQLRGAGSHPDRRWFFTAPEWVLLLALMVAPLLLMTDLMLAHGAFFPRYGAIETVGVVVLTTALLGRWSAAPANRLDGRAALLGSLIVLLMSGLWLAVPREVAAGNLLPTFRNSEPQPKPCQACAETAALDPTIPLVDASGLTFIEMNHREPPSTLARVFYLTDRQASTEYAHADIFEQVPRVVQAFHLAGHSQPYRQFVHEHPRFFVLGRYDYPEDWLLRKLTADHANLRVVGRVNDSYRDTELYEITMPSQ